MGKWHDVCEFFSDPTRDDGPYRCLPKEYRKPPFSLFKAFVLGFGFWLLCFWLIIKALGWMLGAVL